jgi:hypothetical protein
MLFDPASHERLTDAAWSEAEARAAIAAIAADAEEAFDEETLWPTHPLDELGSQPPPVGIYFGAAGVVWALDELARCGAVELRRDWRLVAERLYDRYVAAPDVAEELGLDGPVPSLWLGESGILLVAHRLSPAGWQEKRLLDCVRANVANPTWELMWGSPGTMLVAQVMYERTGDAAWAEAWRDSADRLWDEWSGTVWQQDLYGRTRRFLGPAHGFVGNVYVLARGSRLDGERRAELERRVLAVLVEHAEREDGLAQWPPTLEEPPSETRTQWCHGAPGIVASVATLAPGNADLTELLLAGGELTWRAGPLAKGAGLCHGTGGNGYAFLKLFERTGDERWLDRARAFAMHAVEQVERMRSTYGRGRYTLWTGDLGAALYLWSCISATAAVPTLDSC